MELRQFDEYHGAAVAKGMLRMLRIAMTCIPDIYASEVQIGPTA